MRRRVPHRRLLATALLLAAAALAPAALPAAAAPAPVPVRHGGEACRDGDGLPPATSARLDATVEKVRREAGIPGLVVGVWMPGEGCYVRATGVADKRTGRPMSTGGYVRIGSETKTFTVTALLQLVDEGRVGLDDPIDDYVRGVPNGHRITLRQLAGMRSGLFPYTSDPGFTQDLLSAPKRPFNPWEVLSYGYRHANTFEPGAAFQYSNSNLVLLGLVVEKVTGRRLADVLRERVAGPAGLRHTFLPEGAEFPRPHPRGYTDQTLTGAEADATDWNPSWAWAAGGMISDLEDLRRWAPVLATGKLLSPGTQAQRLKTLPTGFPGTGYGLGILDTNGWIGHNGSLPGYETVTVYLPSRKATLVLMLNTDSLSGGQEPSTLVARAVTEVITPENVYAGSVTPRR
ncbi:serine hydrolase domain-containing protein [Streptomyces omiyaensis]|uniref:serine hydrolase domain-containing protein n=1 Tax=Streptomyces omiyaensis TaxID=68247 RepID=UPI00167A99E9|nr:serine hydrolase domain-containing protein [Streptomyces omiyaensis]GGY24441.1 beta-lactamase [Streptomyces omiyaensis]